MSAHQILFFLDSHLSYKKLVINHCAKTKDGGDSAQGPFQKLDAFLDEKEKTGPPVDGWRNRPKTRTASSHTK